MKVYVIVRYLPVREEHEECLGPVAVYSTLEKAKAWVWYEDSGPITYDIEEYEIDEPADWREG